MKNRVSGPYSHLFSSSHEQTYVAYVAAYAAKIGPFKTSSASQLTYTFVCLIPIIVLVFLIY